MNVTKTAATEPQKEGQKAEFTLDPADWEAMRAIAHRAVDDSIDYLRDVRERPVWRPIPSEVETFLKRPLPQDPTPSWQGYSSAHWDGDTLVIDSNGFRDDLWIDWNGSMITEAAKVRERIRRPDFGRLEIEITIDDPKAYTKPWTVTLRQRLAIDTELVDEICLENEKSYQRMK